MLPQGQVACFFFSLLNEGANERAVYKALKKFAIHLSVQKECLPLSTLLLEELKTLSYEQLLFY